jgi:protein phosphatase 1 regulatory subunit 7
MLNFKGYILLVLFSTGVLAKPLSELKFVDTKLAKCVDEQAASHHWQTVEEFVELSCHNMDIQVADEVASLTALKTLSLFNNNISHLDQRSLTKLETLNLANNAIESLQISGLDHLETLYLFRNKLQSIDLSGLSSVKKVRLMQNALTELDISPLKSLEMGYFFDNQLKDLQITGLSELQFLDVKQNPMPDELYDFYDQQVGIIINHDGNSDDWK